MTDTLGNRVGPYRVWKGQHNFPGLAMSRSIGDKVGDDIGILSTPITDKIETNVANDQFYILASDGIWDAMTNEEAVSFVDKHRTTCKRKSTYRNDDVASTNNCSIAQLLCEEARKRWLKIVEDEDVLIDDISCVVVELAQLRETINVSVELSYVEPEQVEISGIEESEIVVPSSLDPVRKSIIAEDENF